MKKRNVASAILFILAAALLIAGFGMLWKVHMENVADQKKSDRNVEKVEQVIKKEPEKAKDAIPEGTLGIIYIPSYNNFKHVIAYGVDNGTLNDYVGMYKSYSMPGQYGVCVLAAHSTRFAGREKYAFFNRIEDTVKPGDKVNILWNDGNTYEYTVTKVDAWVPKEQEQDYFDKYDDKTKQTLILQTCTHGNGNYRSFVVCNRKENKGGGQ